MIRPWHSKILKSLPVKKKTLTQMLIYEKVPIKQQKTLIQLTKMEFYKSVKTSDIQEDRYRRSPIYDEDSSGRHRGAKDQKPIISRESSNSRNRDSSTDRQRESSSKRYRESKESRGISREPSRYQETIEGGRHRYNGPGSTERAMIKWHLSK